VPFLTGFGKRKKIEYDSVVPGSDLADFPKLLKIVGDSDIAAELAGVGPNGCIKYKEIRYGTIFPGANLTDYPKLIIIENDPDIAREMSYGAGGGYCFTDESNNVLPFGQLSAAVDITAGDVKAYVKLSPLTGASTGDVMCRLWYGRNATTVEDKPGTVSNGYELFMPLEEAPGSDDQRDWVTDTLLGTYSGGMDAADQVAGQVGYGLDFDGTDDRVDVGSLGVFTEATFECWAKISAAQATYAGMIFSRGTNVTGMSLSNDGSRLAYTWNDAPNTYNWTSGPVLVTDGSWSYLAVSVGGSSATAYLGNAGSLSNAVNSISHSSTTIDDVRIADDEVNPGPRWFDGVMDEVRISSVARDDDWIDYTYQDLYNNSDTFTLGPETFGGGIAFTEPDETTLAPFGLYAISDPTAGDLTARVKFANLNDTASPGDTMGWLYYDATQETEEDKPGVVDNDFVLYMPLEELPNLDAPQMRNWVTDTLQGTTGGSMSSAAYVDGQVGKGIDFDGTDDRVAVPSGILNSLPDVQVTVTVWMKPTNFSTAYRCVFDGGANDSLRQLSAFLGSTTTLFFAIGTTVGSEPTVSVAWTPDEWQLLAITCDGTTTRIYRNGVETASVGGGSGVGAGFSAEEWRLGKYNASGPYFLGQQDEPTIAGVVRSADWIEWQYNDDFDNANTFDLGAEEEPGGVGTFTGTSALTISNQTLVASATHEPEHVATSALTVANQTLAASATHNDPDYTATSVLTIANQTLAASATHDDPDYTATSSLTVSNQILSAIGSNEPLFVGTSSLTISTKTLAASGTFDDPDYTATANLSISTKVLAASATHDDPDYTATSSLVISTKLLSASALFANDISIATAALSISAQTLAASAAFVGTAMEFRERFVIDVPDSRIVLDVPPSARLVLDLES
jgi:concanavalin A-like lectin/glucanase superfamily protein